MSNVNSPRSKQNFILHPFYDGLVVKPSFGVRGFGLAFHNIFESLEFGDAKHSRTEDDPQLDQAPRPCALWSLVVWFRGTWECVAPVYHLLSVPQVVSGHLILHALSAQWNPEGRCPILITVCVSHPGK
jgi:hypothetical protein